jgi:hypothetical protein
MLAAHRETVSHGGFQADVMALEACLDALFGFMVLMRHTNRELSSVSAFSRLAAAKLSGL